MEGSRAVKRKRTEAEEVEAEKEQTPVSENGMSMAEESESSAARAQPGQLLLDVLPYVDAYSEEDKKAALRLIQEEMATFKPREDYLNILPPPPIPSFLGGTAELIQAEMERVGAGKPPTGGFDGSRYALRRPQGADEKNPKAWDEAIKQAQLVLQHQHARLANLNLLEQFGPNAWLTNNQRLQSVQQRLDEELHTLRASIEDLNRQRLEEQQAVGTKLQRAQAEWNELVQKNMQLDAACLQLEHELSSLPSASPSDSA